MAFPWFGRSRSTPALQVAIQDAAKQIEAQVPMQTVADGLTNVIAGLGTSRDKRFYSNYSPVTPLQQQDLEAMYTGAWLPGKIVDAVTEDMTREWIKLSWDGYDEDEGGVKAVSVAESKLGVRPQFSDGVRWGRLHGGAGTLMRFKNDGSVLGEPLDLERIKKGDLIALNTFDRWYLTAEGGQMSETPGPGFGMPQFYNLTGLAGAGSLSHIHASRIIRFNGAKTPYRAWLQNGFWDHSVLQKVVDAIKNYDSSTAGVASMVFEASVDILKAQGLTQLLATNGGEAKVTARLLAAVIMKSINRVWVIDKDKEEYGQKTITFAGIKDVLMGMMNDVSGATGIPLTRLFGQSPAGMNATGESDQDNYYDLIRAAQNDNLRPQLEYAYEIIMRSTLGRMPENFAIEFASLWQESDKETADTNKVKADTRKVYWDMGALNEGAIARELKADGSMKTMEDDDVKLAEELAKQPDPVPVVPGALPPKGAPAAPAKGAPPAPAAA